jgi:hypothetical protein
LNAGSNEDTSTIQLIATSRKEECALTIMARFTKADEFPSNYYTPRYLPFENRQKYDYAGHPACLFGEPTK